MALPIREDFIESTRSVRVTNIQFEPSDARGETRAHVDFELKHHDEEETVDTCWDTVPISRTQKEKLMQLDNDWHERKVVLNARSYRGDAFITIVMVQLGDTYVSPQKTA